MLEYAIGGAGGAGLGTVFALMVGLHVLVGIGEGIITAATVGAVAAVRPDLVYLLRGTRPAVTLRTPPARRVDERAPARFLLGFLLAALVIAGGLSYLASPDPTGWTRSPCTAAPSARPRAASSSTAPASPSTRPITRWPRGPLADYAVGGHAGTTGLAGIVGVLVDARWPRAALPGPAAGRGTRSGKG